MRDLVNSNHHRNDAELLRAITLRVQELLATEPELLMSYLYRLDISEEKIKFVLNKRNGIDTVDGLSQAIFERQKARIASKLKYKQKPIEGMDW